MSRKHFIAIAAALRDAEETGDLECHGDLFRSQWVASQARRVRTFIADELARTCPQFDRERFLNAAAFVPAK